MSTPANDAPLPCTVPGCTASHLVTSLDRVDDGREVSETDAVMTAHFRAEHQAKLSKPLVLFVPRPKTTKSGSRRAVRAV